MSSHVSRALPLGRAHAMQECVRTRHRQLVACQLVPLLRPDPARRTLARAHGMQQTGRMPSGRARFGAHAGLRTQPQDAVNCVAAWRSVSGIGKSEAAS